MSELTLCNYCSFEQIKARHPESKVETRPDEYGWQQVYVDGKAQDVHFLELTTHCVC